MPSKIGWSPQAENEQSVSFVLYGAQVAVSSKTKLSVINPKKG